jgi:predicted MFS family arabinose efflux permease
VTTKTRPVLALGLAQTLAWASSYYLPAVLVVPMARDLAVSSPTVFAAFSAALVVSALVGPQVGKGIDRWGGRPLLVGTNVLFAAGLAGLGLAQGPWTLFAAWAVIGIAMGAGLYEAAFATLVRLYGRDSRSAITGITLLAGFASTVGWPLSTLLESQVGWRGACFAWAALHLLLGAPLNASLPRAVAQSPPSPVPAGAEPRADVAGGSAGRTTALLSYAFAATWFVSTAMAAHLPGIVQAGGATLAAAVAVGALVGPAQVAGRLLEFGLLRHVHPLLSARLASLLHPVGAAIWLVLGAPASAVFAVLHGAGNGILTIAKGTLPLVYFGPIGYGYRQGLLTVPTRFAQAMAPWLFGLCLERWGARAMLVSAVLGMTALGALLLLPRPPASET